MHVLTNGLGTTVLAWQHDGLRVENTMHVLTNGLGTTVLAWEHDGLRVEKTIHVLTNGLGTAVLAWEHGGLRVEKTMHVLTNGLGTTVLAWEHGGLRVEQTMHDLSNVWLALLWPYSLMNREGCKDNACSQKWPFWLCFGLTSCVVACALCRLTICILVTLTQANSEDPDTVKPVLSSYSKRRPIHVWLVFKTDYRLMMAKSIAECSEGSILQYFRPSLSYHLSLKSFFFVHFWVAA